MLILRSWHESASLKQAQKGKSIKHGEKVDLAISSQASFGSRAVNLFPYEGT